MIDILDVSKSFGKLTAVDRVSFLVDRGEAVALLGANGAGKSTLIKCILGLLDFKGLITVNGSDIKENPKQVKSLIGYVPQEPMLYDMRTMDILNFFGSIRRTGKERIDHVLNITGLAEHASKSTSELSGGMRQRLSFAIALLSSPPVLLLDEPTSNLDAQARTDFLNLVSEYKKEGNTVLFSSHRLDEVDLLADRVLFMKAGRVIFEGRPGSLGDTLGLKVNINIVIPEPMIEEALSLLLKEGFEGVSKNGRGINIEIESARRVAPIKKLIEGNIQVDDFSVEEPSMEGLISQIESNGYS